MQWDEPLFKKTPTLPESQEKWVQLTSCQEGIPEALCTTKPLQGCLGLAVRVHRIPSKHALCSQVGSSTGRKAQMSSQSCREGPLDPLIDLEEACVLQAVSLPAGFSGPAFPSSSLSSDTRPNQLPPDSNPTKWVHSFFANISSHASITQPPGCQTSASQGRIVDFHNDVLLIFTT